MQAYSNRFWVNCTEVSAARWWALVPGPFRARKLAGRQADDRGMTDRAPAPVVDRIAVTSPEAQRILRVYFAEMASRYYGRQASAAEIDQALARDPSTDLRPPTGVFLILRDVLRPIGCVGVRLADSTTAEVQRLFVLPSARRRGFGSCLLAVAEGAARRLGAEVLRLNTGTDLGEARRLYARHGYTESPAFTGEPHAQHWLVKNLSPAAASVQDARRLGGAGR